MNLGVPAARPTGDPAGALCGRRGRVLGACLILGGQRGRADRSDQVLAVPGDRPLNGLAKVVPQVPAVSGLDRFGRAAGAAV